MAAADCLYGITMQEKARFALVPEIPTRTIWMSKQME